MAGCPVSHHGMSKALGCQHAALGKFGRLFDLDPLEPSDAILESLGASGGLMHDQQDKSSDSELPAGYTFFAQFVDHDVTLDTQSMLDQLGQNPGNIGNLRTPSLDLDCVYGFGPEASPHLYNPDASGRLLEGTAANPNDVPRNSAGTALIGDPRNDENLFVSQLQLLFIQFHNKMLDRNIGAHFVDARERFEATVRSVRFHYQWIVLYDFLARVCDEKVYNFAIKTLESSKPFPLVYKPDSSHPAFMPVEFSVGAYRFGHTLVRSAYPANGSYPRIKLFDEEFGTLGFSPLPSKLVVDWRLLLDVDPCIEPLNSKAFDHLLANELICLPEPVVGSPPKRERSLAFRNLVRGRSLGLPSGQDIKQALSDAGYSGCFPKTHLDLTKLPGYSNAFSNAEDAKRTAQSTPLFFYLMAEGLLLNKGMRLGPVCSSILLEVFIGLLTHCEDSFLAGDGWRPDPCVAGDGRSRREEDRELTLADIVRFVGR